MKRFWSIDNEDFELDDRFKVIDYLGSGAYGMVCAVFDCKTLTHLAIKKCKKIFHSRTMAKRALREIRLLRQLNHLNIVQLKYLLQPTSLEHFTSLYLVFELMETDLSQVIKSNQSLCHEQIQYFIHQLLRALEYLHSLSIVHRDVKPRNILVNGDCQLKLADFGLARIYNPQNDHTITAMTEYVTTRWYRAPEILVGWTAYSSAVDMWAVGCIVCELLLRKPLFLGSNSFHQLESICQFLGKPSDEFIQKCTKTAFRSFLDALPMTTKDQLILTLQCSPLYENELVDLAFRLLRFIPIDRISAEDAIAHCYFHSMHCSSNAMVRSPSAVVDEKDGEAESSLVANDSMKLTNFSFEGKKLKLEEYRSEIVSEVQLYENFWDDPGDCDTFQTSMENEGSSFEAGCYPHEEVCLEAFQGLLSSEVTSVTLDYDGKNVGEEDVDHLKSSMERQDIQTISNHNESIPQPFDDSIINEDVDPPNPTSSPKQKLVKLFKKGMSTMKASKLFRWPFFMCMKENHEIHEVVYSKAQSPDPKKKRSLLKMRSPITRTWFQTSHEKLPTT